MIRAAFQTARLHLRPVAQQDEGPVLDMLNDMSVSSWLAVVPHPYTAADFRLFQTEMAKPGLTFAVDDGQGLAGVLGLPRSTLGYWFAPRAQGQGYATEAARAALNLHFADNVGAIASGYFEGKDRSARVLEKLGFIEVARDHKFCRALGQDRPHVSLTLTPEAFHKSST